MGASPEAIDPAPLPPLDPLGGSHPLERPRERMLVFGAQALSDIELIALVLGGGHAVPRAVRLLQHAGGLRGLARSGVRELMSCDGVGEASATSVCAAVELTRRLGRLELPIDRRLDSPAEVARFARALLLGRAHEAFLVVGLDVRKRVCLVHEVGSGTVAHVEIHPREVFRPLIREGAHAALFVHNHPSGDMTPSQRDLEVTGRLAEVGVNLGIPVLDHLVVTDFGCSSLVALGLMPVPPIFGVRIP